jgi:hypothetical protein
MLDNNRDVGSCARLQLIIDINTFAVCCIASLVVLHFVRLTSGDVLESKNQELREIEFWKELTQ